MKHLFRFRVKPKESLTSTTRNRCGSIAVVDTTVKGRSTVHRALCIVNLLIALSFGFSSQAWATNARDLKDNINHLYYTGEFNSWSTNNADYEFSEKVDGNHYKGVMYVPANQSEKTFKLYADAKNSKSGYYAAGSYGFHKDWGGGEFYMGTDKNDDKLSTISATSGYVKVEMEFYAQYGSNSYLKFTQTEVSKLGASLSASSTTISAEGTTTLTPGGTGGSGSYTYSYSDGNAGGSFNGNVYTAPLVTAQKTITITLTVKDEHNVLKDKLTAATKTINLTVKPLIYDVIFNTNGGTINSGEFSSYTKGVGATLPTDVTKTGYDFAGWFLNNAGSAVTAISTSDTGDKSYTAHWTAKSYTLTWNLDGGTAGTGTITGSPCAYGTVLQYTVNPTKTGYEFNGWNPTMTSGTTTMPAAHSTYVAQWTPITYTVVFNANGGEGDAPASINGTYDVNLSALPNYTGQKAGYAFGGWNTQEDGQGTTYAVGATDVKNLTAEQGDTVTLYAKWIENSQATIIMAVNNANGGTITPEAGEYTKEVGSSFPISAVANTGYDFTRWEISNTDVVDFGDNASNANVSARNLNIKVASPEDANNNLVVKSAGSATVTANFTAKTTTLTLNGNEGTPESQALTMSYDATSLPADYVQPTRTGYDYSGYGVSTAASTTKIILKDNTFTTSGGDTQSKWVTDGKWTRLTEGTLYACWTAHYKTIDLNKHYTQSASAGYGADGKAKITVGTATATDYKAATRTGHILLGYSVDEEGTTMVMDKDGNFIARVTGYTDSEGKWIQDITNGTITKLYAQWQECMTTVTVTTEHTDWGKLKIGNSNKSWGETVEVSKLKESYQLTATANTGYKFIKWELNDGAVLSTGTLTDASIKVKGDSVHTTGTATANFEEDLNTGWRINLGNDGLEHWFTNDFVKKSGESTLSVGYVELDLTENCDYKFKVVKKGDPEKWYGNTGTMTSDNCTNWTFYQKYFEQDMKDAHIQCTAAGKYIFKVDYSGSDPVVSVTYPAAQTFAVTISADANGSVEPNGEQQVDAFTGISVTATPNPGYHFAGWVKSTGITVTSETATTTVKASQVGTLQATFAKNTPLYFKNAIKDKWSPSHMYVYLYKDNTYWEGTGGEKQDRGTGSDTKMYNGSCIAGPLEMTRLQNTDIWEYDYDPALSFNTVVFAEQTMDGYEWFAECTAIRRADYNDCMNMFVLNEATEEWHNTNARYFNKGFWKNYDAESAKLYIHMDDQNDMEFATKEGPNEYSVTRKLEPSGSGDHYYNYYFYIGSCNGANYSVEGGIISPEHPSITLYKFELNPKEQNKQVTLKANVQGDYTFTVIHNDDNTLTLTVDYPFGVGDYRLVSVHNGQEHWNGFVYKKQDGTNRASFFVENGDQVKLQYVSDITGERVTWSDVTPAVSVTITGLEKSGVYNFDFEQSGTINTITNAGAYSGDFYIRTDGVDGGWSGYQANKDNKIEAYGSMLNAGSTYNNFLYNHYKAKWINKNVNVKFCIANDYSKDLSGYFESDDIIDNPETTERAEEELPQEANVRFMWNSETNQLARAYLSGSTNPADRFLVLSGDAKIYDKDGNPITADILGNNETILNDNGNWVYQIDIQANPTARGQLTARYNSKTQYFKGNDSGDSWEERSEEIIGGTYTTSDKKYLIRMVYDFKTNRLVSAWLPVNNDIPIGDVLPINADIMLVRHAQEAAQIITFTGKGALTEVKTIYSAIELRKDSMVGRLGSWTPYAYSVCNYYVSFPYDVKLSEVFGIGEYGTNWQMQYYDGAKRAEIGWFAETKGFWTSLSKDSTLHAHTGYLLQLNKNVLNKDDGAIWKNTKDHASVYIYFPSNGEIGRLSEQEVTVPVPAHECKIDRTFAQDADPLSPRHDNPRNHKITDSHWNVIGLPIFQNEKKQIVATEVTDDLHYVYQWGIEDSTKIANGSDNRTNTLEIVAAGKDFNFKAMHGYIVQYYGNITWHGSAITPAPVAARYMDEEKKNYTIDLQVLNNNGARESRTYVELAENAKDDFQFNEDVYLMAGSAAANIYSFAGSYDVAANVLSVNNHEIPLGIEVKTAGTYTFHTPSQFDGIATLIDHAANTETILNADDYSVYLDKGTCEGRFTLKLDVVKTQPTNLDNVNGQNRLFKFIRNEQLYILRDGKLYNAIGADVK